MTAKDSSPTPQATSATSAAAHDTASVDRRRFLRTGAAVGAAAAAGGLLGPAAALAARPELSSKPYTINFYAQSYGPSTPTKTNPHPATAMKKLADAYHQLHPNITIAFEPNNVGQSFGAGQEGIFSWLTAQAAAGRAPDITWSQWISVNAGFFPNGLFLDLKPYFQQPNHYVAGNKRWLDIFNPSVIEAITAPHGELYAVDCDYVATGIYYNKALWKQAGISAPPATWADFLSVQKQLKSKGLMPLGFSLSSSVVPSWWERQASSQLFQEEARQINVTHDSFIISATDYAVGVKKGIFSMKNPRYAAIWTLLKEWSQYWVPGASAINFGNGNAGLSDLTLLIQNRCAMVWEGSWAGIELDQQGFANKWGVFPFPTITKATTPYATGIHVGDVVGGPNAGFQYFVVSQKGNNALTNDKLAWIIDWLQYISTPANVQLVVNENPTTVPTVVGAKPANQTLASLVPVGKPGLSISGIFNDFLGPQATQSALQMLQSYINGSFNDQTFATKFDALLQSSADAWAKQNKIDLGKYLK